MEDVVLNDHDMLSNKVLHDMIGFHMYQLSIQMHTYKISLLLFDSCNYIGHDWDYRHASSCVYPIDMETLSTSFHGDRSTDLWNVSAWKIRIFPNDHENLLPSFFNICP